MGERKTIYETINLLHINKICIYLHNKIKFYVFPIKNKKHQAYCSEKTGQKHNSLTLSPLLITIMMTYTNSLDLDGTPSNVSPGSKLFDIQTTFSPTLNTIEAFSKLKKTRNLGDNNLFSGLSVNLLAAANITACTNYRLIQLLKQL